jgi:hypothetical protein
MAGGKVVVSGLPAWGAGSDVLLHLLGLLRWLGRAKTWCRVDGLGSGDEKRQVQGV